MNNIIPTISNDLIQDLLDNYLLENSCLILINYPEMGFDNTPTQNEINLRKNLDMEEVSLRETSLQNNGYLRSLVGLSSIVSTSKPFARIITGSFKAQGGPIGPFTHVVLARDTNIINADFSNGNNRGDSAGVVISCSPVPVRSLEDGTVGNILEDGQELAVTLPINLVSRSFSHEIRQ